MRGSTLDDRSSVDAALPRGEPRFSLNALFAGWRWSLLFFALLCGLAFSLPQVLEAWQGDKPGAPILKFVKYEVAAAMLVVVATVLGNWKHPPLPRWLGLSIAVIVGTAVGVVGGEMAEGRPLVYALFQWRFSLAVFGFLAAIYYFFERETYRAAELREIESDRHRLEAQRVEAELALMQAQVEPHFLFNTLAHVKRLYQIDPDSGATMIERYCDYLEGALPRIRSGRSTLEEEFDLVRAYLDIQKIRMGHRLAFEVELPEALRSAEFPPMMCLSLVENAVKHGLGPVRGGGRLSVVAAPSGAGLRVSVADTGAGLQPGGGAGIGLSNTRARLAALYGARAAFRMQSNTPRGLIATIDLPLNLTAPKLSGAARDTVAAAQS